MWFSDSLTELTSRLAHPTKCKETGHETPRPSDDNTKRGLCYKYNRGACRRGESCRYEHDAVARSKCMIGTRKTAEKRMYLRMSGRAAGQTSLVRRLLMKEIKTEEFVILETVRFLCENAFLQTN